MKFVIYKNDDECFITTYDCEPDLVTEVFKEGDRDINKFHRTETDSNTNYIFVKKEFVVRW